MARRNLEVKLAILDVSREDAALFLDTLIKVCAVMAKSHVDAPAPTIAMAFGTINPDGSVTPIAVASPAIMQDDPNQPNAPKPGTPDRSAN